MITLFLAFPIVGDSADDLEQVYLKPLEAPALKDVEAVLTQALKSCRIVNLDDCAVVYDNARLSSLIKIVKDEQEKNKTKENPDISRLLKLMNDWIDCNQKNGVFASVSVNDVTLTQGILCAYVNIRQTDNDLVVDINAIEKIEGIRVKDQEGKNIKVNFIVASEKDIYKWFADHRIPHRKIDEAYEKHSSKEKVGKKGVKISTNTYKTEVAEDMLKWAVGSKTNETNRMYFLDKQEKKLLVFWNEDGIKKYFHVYEVAEDDKEELSKIWTYKDGRELNDKILTIAELYVPVHE